MADFQNVNSFVIEQSIVFHKAAVQNIYNVYYIKTPSMCIFILTQSKCNQASDL